MRRLIFGSAVIAALLVAPAAAHADLATKFTSAISSHVVSYDAPATLSGTLKVGSLTLGDVDVYLLRDGVRVAKYRLDKHGNIRKKVKFPGHAHWQLKFGGIPGFKPSFSPTQYSDAKKVYSGTLTDMTDSDPKWNSPWVDPKTGITYYMFEKTGLKLTAGHKYEFVTPGHLAESDLLWQSTGQNMASVLSAFGSFTYSAPKTGSYVGLWYVPNSADPTADDSLALYIW